MKKALTLGLLLMLLSPLGAWGSGLPEGSLEKSKLEAQLRFLASDELAGRETGTPGNDVAARYIAEHFRAAGVAPAPGTDDYFQSVPLIRPVAPQEVFFEFRGRKWRLGEDLLLIRGSGSAGPALALMEEHPDPENHQSESESFDGQVVFTRFQMPRRPKLDGLAEAGAVALVEVYSGNRWDRLQNFLSHRPLVLAESAAQYSTIPHFVIRLDGEQQPDVAAGEQVTFDVAAWDLQPVVSRNVVGVIAGADPELKQEFVALMAHYDHLGAGEDKMFATPEDVIFNGARDNGMGVVALLGAAQSLALEPPTRSILLLALTGEEQGLLGSAHYVAHPLVPLEKTRFALNVDGGGYSDTGVVTVIGLEESGRQPLFEQGAAEFGLEAIPAPAQARGLISRSDNANFSRRGVPAVIFSPGFRNFDAETTRHYHRPSDEADENFDFDYLRVFCQAYVRTARKIADER